MRCLLLASTALAALAAWVSALAAAQESALAALSARVSALAGGRAPCGRACPSPPGSQGCPVVMLDDFMLCDAM